MVLAAMERKEEGSCWPRTGDSMESSEMPRWGPLRGEEPAEEPD